MKDHYDCSRTVASFEGISQMKGRLVGYYYSESSVVFCVDGFDSNISEMFLEMLQ